jgi:transcriptional regulator with PAS, ATPase and Fis domain
MERQIETIPKETMKALTAWSWPGNVRELENLMERSQRIGASRETVTRLLSNLRKKRLIRLDGPTLVIRDRNGLRALAV